jgi:hypothetical protein
MNRDEFFATLAPLDAEQRGKVLWNLYRRGTAAVRERIEGELDPRERERRKKAAPPDPDLVLMEVRDFVELAESGAYIAELDRIAVAGAPPAVKKNTRARRDWERSSWSRDSAKRDRAGGFARWNSVLLERLDGERARRLAGHAPFGGPEADFLKARRLPWDVCRAVRPLACSTTKYGSTASTSSPRPCVCWNVANRAGRRPSCLTRCLRSWR